MQPIALTYPREGARIEQGRYGTMLPVTAANGMMLICKTKPRTGDAIHSAGDAIAKVVQQQDPRTRLAEAALRARGALR
jgi:hypothetical protein